MQFKDLSDETLKRLGDRIIRNAKARIERQVPSPRNNPRPSGRDRLVRTGNLLRSLQFNWDKNSSGSWALTVDYLDYGVYTAFGTSTRYKDEAARQAGFFGREFRGYRRGKGGIRPQYWLSLRDDRPVYEAIVEAELRMTFQTFLNNTISGFSRGTDIGREI
jgi:hypothetical protein